MASIPAKVAERLVAGIKKFQPILEAAKARDVNESDTVIIVTDMLSDVFGYDKYSEITSEYVIRGTYVDLAIKLEGHLQMLIEVKAIGSDLKDAHIRQAVDYGANQGVDWILLTNGASWQIYKVNFGKPVDQELILEIDFLGLSPRNADDIEDLFLITREGLMKSMLGEYHAQRQALSRYFIGALLLSDSVLDVIRRELRKASPNVRIDNDQIEDVLLSEILKRDVVEGEKADDARRKISRAVSRAERKAEKEKMEESDNDGANT